MSLTSIDLGLRELLRDPQRTQEFFKAITQDEIASQIRALRKKRAMTQSVFAERAKMKQSAVSRIEQADYSSWTLTTLFRVAAALGARWRVILEPVEDAASQLEKMENVGACLFDGQAANNFVQEQMSGRFSEAEQNRRSAATSIASQGHIKNYWHSSSALQSVGQRERVIQ